VAVLGICATARYYVPLDRGPYHSVGCNALEDSGRPLQLSDAALREVLAVHYGGGPLA